MSPHHFAKLSKNHSISETESNAEEKAERALIAAVAIIAEPIRAAMGKKRPIDRDKP